MSLQWKMTQPFPQTKQLSINWYEKPSKRTAALKSKTTHQYSHFCLCGQTSPGASHSCMWLSHLCSLLKPPFLFLHPLQALFPRHLPQMLPACISMCPPLVPQLLEGLPPFWHISPLLSMLPSKSLLQSCTRAKVKKGLHKT